MLRAKSEQQELLKCAKNFFEIYYSSLFSGETKNTARRMWGNQPHLALLNYHLKLLHGFKDRTQAPTGWTWEQFEREMQEVIETYGKEEDHEEVSD